MRRSLPHATIFADASYCSITKAAGWGAWMVARDRQSLLKGGEIRGCVATSVRAELLALANAIFLADKAGYLTDGVEIMLQSDCMAVLGYIRHEFGAEDRPHYTAEGGGAVAAQDPKAWPRRSSKAWHAKADLRAALHTIRQIKERRKLRLVVRHVKGHRGKKASEGDGRAWVNQECDRLARIGMIKARMRLTEERRAREGGDDDRTDDAPAGGPPQSEA